MGEIGPGGMLPGPPCLPNILPRSKLTMNLDVLIIDRKHLNFGLATNQQERPLENALIFEDRPDLASAFADWYDSSVLASAKTYEAWHNTDNNCNHNAREAR